MRRQIIPNIQAFYETGQQGVHDLYRIIRQSPDALMQGLRQFNNDADAFFDAFFNGTQQGRYLITPNGRIIDMRDMPNVVQYAGNGGGGNPIGGNKPCHFTDDEWDFITTNYGDNPKIMALAIGDHHILRNLNEAQRTERLLLLDGTEEAIEIVTNQRYQAALNDYHKKVSEGKTPPRFPNREHIEHGVIADSKGFILESNVRKNLLGNGLKFIELKPGVHIYNDDMLRRHLGIKTGPCADFMVQNPNTGDFIIVESKASISEISHGVNQIQATFNATTNRYPIESAAIYTNQDTFEQLMSGRTGRYSLQAIEVNNQANTYHLIDTETGNPVRVSANDANSPIITVIKITG